jgi:two-component system, chemotaxis family, CheB/CheR fusion protein
VSQERSAEFAALLELLKSERGFDFTGYKLSSLMRRVQKRMGEVGADGYGAYADYLQVHPDEFLPLFNTILINVTGFFRDPEAWEYLAQEILPRLAERPADQPIRVWSAGCATGQEAYAVAMLLADALGEDAFRERVKIYATDADEEALAAARAGSYSERELADVPEALRRRFFPGDGRRQFRPELRRNLVFGRHDLVRDAAISRLDLLICRNTLMYLNAETQAKVLAGFHFSLHPAGYLFLGRAETLLGHGGSFRPVSLKRRVFQCAPGVPGDLDRHLAAYRLAGGDGGGATGRQLRDAAFQQGAVAQLVIDGGGHLGMASESARRMFDLAPADLGRLIQDLEVSYRPIDLRSAMEKAHTEHAVVRLPEVAWTTADGERLQLDVQVMPLVGKDQGSLGTAVCFYDRTQAKQLTDEVERVHQELQAAYEELQSANEELETTNEELQSTVEELETTNEELQSANEELETMNEELQSTNEELRTVNDRLHERSEEADEANVYLESVLGAFASAVVVVNDRLEVEVWNRRAADLWGLRPEEARGKPVTGLDIGIPGDGLGAAVRDALDGDGKPRAVSFDGHNRRGRPISCKITCSRLDGPAGDGRVLLVMDEAPRPTA